MVRIGFLFIYNMRGLMTAESQDLVSLRFDGSGCSAMP
jgi:hypothetical protein